MIAIEMEIHVQEDDTASKVEKEFAQFAKGFGASSISFVKEPRWILTAYFEDDNKKGAAELQASLSIFTDPAL